MRESSAVEYFGKIAVALNYFFFAGLKIGLGQFGLDQQRAQSHVHFGAVELAARQRHARFESEFRHGGFVNSEQRKDASIVEDARMAEDVHEQRVGAVAGIQLTPEAAIIARESGARAGVHFVQTPCPERVGKDGAVSFWEEISVCLAVGLVTDYRRFTIAQAVREPVFLGESKVARTDFLAQRQGMVRQSGGRSQASHSFDSDDVTVRTSWTNPAAMPAISPTR